MKCACGETAILNTVLGKDFYYCRKCKEEVLLSEAEPIHNLHIECINAKLGYYCECAECRLEDY